MKNVFMIVHGLDVNKGGMTTAMLDRSKIFYDNKINADIVTFDYKQNYDEILNSLKKQGKMDKRTKMFNLFKYYKNKSSSKTIKYNKKLYNLVDDFIKNTIEIREDTKISRFFDTNTGEYKAYKITKSKREKVIDLFNNNKRLKRIYFKNNKIHQINVFNQNNKVVYETFYDNKGFPYISRNINPKTGNVGRSYLLVDKIKFNNNAELCNYFLKELIKDIPNNIMICDGPGSFPKMLNTTHKKAKKLAIIHVNHHKNFKNDGSVKEKEDYIIKNADNINGVIVLTESQKKDIKEEYDVKNVYTISNFIKVPKEKKFTQRKKIVGHISRIVATKGIKYLLEVAELVIQEDENVEFQIYGEGPEKEKIQEIINEKGLNKNVKLLGYTSTPQQAIRDFKCVLSTSQYEGQGLSMIEAMLLKKPVIAFNIKYGPSEFITNGNNGYLISNFDIKGMANKVLNILNNDDLAEKLGEEARKTIIEKYSSDNLLKKWKMLFDE